MTHVAGWYAGRFMGEQHALFAGFGYFRPEHAVQDIGVGISTRMPALPILSPNFKDLGSVSICRLMCSIIWCTALTLTSPF